MNRIVATAAAISILAVAAPAGAAISTYADQSAFDAAAAATTLFDFNGTPNGSFNGTSYDVGPFTLTGDSTGGLSDLAVTGGQVNANVCADCDPAFGYTITFDAAITAFGADFSNVFGGTGITFTVGGDSFAGPVVNSGFFGFTSTSAFTTIQISGGNEVHNFDNVRYAVAVPEPVTWALMVGGFGLAGASLRRRRLSAA